MNMFILDNELYVRFGFFFGIFAVMALWELYAPRRALTARKIARWFINLAITFMNPLALRVVLPLPATGVALVAGERSWRENAAGGS
jgi:hypothetical protein